MINLREYRDNPDRVSDLLPWAALVAPDVVLNKDGSLQTTIKYRGPDLDSATEAELISVAARLNNILKRTGSGWAIYVEAQRRLSQDYPRSDWADPISFLLMKSAGPSLRLRCTLNHTITSPSFIFHHRMQKTA